LEYFEELITLSIFMLFLGHIIVVLSKVDWSLKGLILWHKHKIDKFVKNNFNEVEDIEEIIKPACNIKTEIKGIKKENYPIKEKLEKINEETESTDLNSVFPFKVLDNSDMSQAEIELRQRLIKKIKEKPSYFMDNGEKKLVVPLESIVFLNKDLNPLVNEYGEIIIRIKEEKHANLTGYKIVLEDTGEIIFDNDIEVVSALKELDELSKAKNISLKEINEMLKEKIKEREALDNKEEKPKSLILEELEETPEEDKENEKTEEVEEKKELLLTEEDLEDLMEEIEENTEKPKLNSLDSLIEEFEEFEEDSENEEELEDSEDKEESVLELLKSLKWQEKKGIEFTPKDFKSFIENTFETEEDKIKLFTNILKHKNLVFNDNKTAVYVDNIILFDSISKLFGNDSEIIFNKFAKIKGEIQKSFERNFLATFEEEITKKFSLSFFTDGSNCFKGYGIWFSLDSFKPVFKNDEEFDFFRSYPITKYKTTQRNEECKARFISNKDNLYI